MSLILQCVSFLEISAGRIISEELRMALEHYNVFERLFPKKSTDALLISE